MQGVPAIARWSRRLVDRLRNPEYRSAFVAENVRTKISYQIRALRAQRGWQQKTLAERMGKPQSVVCRLEDPDYGKPSIQSLLEIAAAFDVALVIEFVGFKEFLRRTRDVSPGKLTAPSFDERQFSSFTSVFNDASRYSTAFTQNVAGFQSVAALPSSTASLEATVH